MTAIAHAKIPRQHGLDATRGYAALAVMLFHFSPTMGRERWFPNGYLAVDLFFCLSGLVLWLNYAERIRQGMSGSRFLAERLIRLYPLYAAGLAVGFSALACQQAWGHAGVSLWDALLRGLVYLPTGAENWLVFGPAVFTNLAYPLNNPSWSLLFELVAGMSLVFWARRSVWLLALGLLILLAAWVKLASWQGQAMAGGWGQDNFWIGLPRSLFSLGMGIGIGRLWQQYPHRFNQFRIPQVGIALLVTALLFVPAGIFRNPSIFLLASVAVFIPAIIALNLGTPQASTQVFGPLGDLSYPVYALHVPIYTLIEELAVHWGQPRSSWMVIGLSICSVYAAAHLALRWVDRPGRAWLRKLLPSH